jgi:hypothetical protein
MSNPVADTFSNEQLDALKAIANRLVNKQPSNKPAAPQITPVQAQNNTQPIQTVRSTPTPAPTPTRTSRTKKKVKRKKKPKTIVIKPPTEEEGNVGSDGTNYAQTVGASKKPQQMPSQQQQNAMAQSSVEVAQGARSSGQAGELGTLLNAAIVLAQNQNKDVKEDES